MKKILVTTLVACALVSSALAQGQITFSAGSTPTDNRIRFLDAAGTSTLVPAGNPAQAGSFGNLNVALYGAPVGTALNLVNGLPDLTGAWKIQTSPILQQLVAPGTMTGKIVQMPASVLDAAGNLQLTVVAWTGTATDFMSAVANQTPTTLFAFTGDKNSGGALTWVSGSGSATTPFVITKGASAYNGLVLAPVPEPSTFALAGLGAAALLIFRRRQ